MPLKTTPKIAYLILAHDDPEHLARLLSRLNHQADFFVHIDLDSDIARFQQTTASLAVHFVHDRVRIRWGTFSIVLATLRLLRAALDSAVPYAKVVLLSGSCYPAKPPQHLHHALVRDPNHNHIRFLRWRDSAAHRRYIMHYWLGYGLVDQRKPSRLIPPAIKKYARQLIDASLRPLPRHMPCSLPGLEPCFGSQFFGISVSCARYIMRFAERYPEMEKHWRTTFAPDEHFFHTIIANSPYGSVTEGFVTQADPQCAYRDLATLHLIAPDYKFMDLRDYPEILASTKLFVRKVGSSNSRSLLERIDEEIIGAKPWIL